MTNLLKWLWQLPQNLLAICLEGIFCKAITKREIKNGIYTNYCIGFPAGFSLGNYIFIPENSNEATKLHELGHCMQSVLLGPLYLLIIGIPSVIHNIVHTICSYQGIHWDYYQFYTESWANDLISDKLR